MHFITTVRASSLKEFYLFIYLLALVSSTVAPETLVLSEPFHILRSCLFSGQNVNQKFGGNCDW